MTFLLALFIWRLKSFSQDRGNPGFIVAHIRVRAAGLAEESRPGHLVMTNGLILTLPVALALKATVILSLDRFTPFTLLVAIVGYDPRR